MSHKSKLGGFSIDCQTKDLGDAAQFWANAFGSRIVADNGNFQALEEQSGLSCEVQSVDHPPRVHLDIETDDVAAEERRLTKHGAKRVKAVGNWVVMEAPTGHRFYIVPTDNPDFDTSAREWS